MVYYGAAVSAQLENTGVEPLTARLSVTLPMDEYRELKRLSKRNRVSVAWLVRNAVTDYLKAQAPLFSKTGTRN